jgi:hypothetical protein
LLGQTATWAKGKYRGEGSRSVVHEWFLVATDREQQKGGFPMLRVPTSQVSPADPAIKRISGRILAKRIRKDAFDLVHRARLALQLQRGEVVIGNLTAKQARQLVGISVDVLAAARQVMPAAPRPRTRTVRNRVTYKRDLSEGDVERLIAQLGEERVLAALDRVTQPAAAVNGRGKESDQPVVIV